MALDEIRNIKIEKVKELRKAGTDPYPAVSGRTHTVSEALNKFDELSDSGKEIVLAGRVMAKREMGGAVFFDIYDGSGKIQGLLKEDVAGEKEFGKFKEFVDIGDFIEIKGTLFLTKAGERTLSAISYRLLAKALLPLPEKWHGLEDAEERLRKRYLDLIMNPEEKELFVKKSRFWQATRRFLLKEGGLEVDTPILEQVPGGADAEPFKTHLNVLNIDLFLRISPELSLKRLITAGYEKIFEIGRIFRNEGIDREHLQDYAQMEMYWAYYDYEKLMELVERLFKHIVKETLGAFGHQYQNKTIDWNSSWQRYDYYKEFKKHTGLNLDEIGENDLINYAKDNGIDAGKHIGKGRLIDVIFKKKVRPHLIEPGFLVLPPIDIEPLAKRYPKDPNRVERFQVVAGGTELGKGFSELNDPIDQRERFEEQTKLGEAGDKEAQRMDESFVESLEYGMPPTAGFGMSERFFAFLVDRPVREVVFFPLMKPKIK
ncbi:MAG: lysine--tRNA ligase [Candidatus Yanofskybacteria bacterium RIFCSPHIGHO2_01_FULL_43_42]|uniref:Lysine--tRNA ligase n=1 Tax=Candidatus Yanofskybacteria bacterium RIFCSPLOWO2_01_FULL_43_22 TaxID=1802695 RepID=A0A1F8GHF8_9BACT|nr:MAG: lysine--tRNA ligase [Candidatus Yanofskybacteria bacterium RIFCSPHIGHO2_01_FULL_43_42]OGN13451.1 MAG: lysine--tRNA ligase [Candidatus Yanofskybacteria bacterium RIFCSPHIGHO2_02_FULL_43_17]OGN24822.1 MAG: lysine--tRNA ligase [Candidatus Yanofskybacteria bacterium RIFCSPLOWO2_01_FULL_43_22]